MSSDGSVTFWINRLKAGDRDAASQQLWEGYFEKLVRQARTRLAGLPGRSKDAEDVALSAFNSFVLAAEANRFPRLDDRDNLWAVLLTITPPQGCPAARKATEREARRWQRPTGIGGRERCSER